MGCIGDREKGEVDEAQKWDYITLPDFHATSFWTYLSYGWLWFLAIVAVAVYAADTFTAVNLLAFDKWASAIEPAIPFKYSRWIFAICIIVSWVLCGFEWLRAIRVIRRGGVAESYMDPLAVTLQSMRPQGWKRFLVVAELTKSRKGADYVALFVYFQFKHSVRVVLAEGARQVVNAMTLYSVMEADLVPTGTHAAAKGHSSIAQFFINLGTLYTSDKEQAVVLFTMLFTLVIWVISALSLLAALILYLTFLWHYVPQSDGRLSIYCRRKIDRRLEKIVGLKVKAALEVQEKQRQKEEAKAAKSSCMPIQPARQPTLPRIDDEFNEDDKMSDFDLVRQQTNTTLPLYTFPAATGQALQRQPTLPDLGRPGMSSRNGTSSSAVSSTPSYTSNTPLLDNADGMGYNDDRMHSPSNAMAAINRQMSDSPSKSGLAQARSATQSPFGRAPTRSNTGFSLADDITGLPSRYNHSDAVSRPQHALYRQDTQTSLRSQQPYQRQMTPSGPKRSVSPADRPGTAFSAASHRTPAPQGYEMTPQAVRQPSPARSPDRYIAFNPLHHSPAGTPSPSISGSTRRTVTTPMHALQPSGEDFFIHAAPQRSFTAPPPQGPANARRAHVSVDVGAYDDLLDDYSPGHARSQLPPRSATAKPMPAHWAMSP